MQRQLPRCTLISWRSNSGAGPNSRRSVPDRQRRNGDLLTIEASTPIESTNIIFYFNRSRPGAKVNCQSFTLKCPYWAIFSWVSTEICVRSLSSALIWNRRQGKSPWNGHMRALKNNQTITFAVPQFHLLPSDLVHGLRTVRTLALPFVWCHNTQNVRPASFLDRIEARSIIETLDG